MASSAMASVSSKKDLENPMLSEEAILLSVKHYTKIPFSLADLRVPTREKLESIFGAFVCCVLDIPHEQVCQIPLHVMETISNPDLHLQEGAGYIQFNKVLSYFFDRIGVTDFDLNDFVYPKKKRTRKLLSALVNFAQFCSSYSDPIKTDILSKIETLKESQSTLDKTKKHCQEKIGVMEKENLEKQKAVQELNLQGLKAELEELEVAEKQQINNNARIQAEVEEMKNMLTIRRASRMLKEGAEAVEICSTRASTLISKEELVRHFEEVIPSALHLIKDIEQDANKCHLISKELENVNDRNLELTKSHKCVVAQIQNMDSLIVGKKEKKRRFLSKSRDMNKLVNETEQRFLKKKEVIQDDVRKKCEEIERIREETDKKGHLMKLYREQHDETMKTLDNSFKSLQSREAEFNDKLRNTFCKWAK